MSGRDHQFTMRNAMLDAIEINIPHVAKNPVLSDKNTIPTRITTNFIPHPITAMLDADVSCCNHNPDQ